MAMLVITRWYMDQNARVDSLFLGGFLVLNDDV